MTRKMLPIDNLKKGRDLKVVKVMGADASPLFKVCDYLIYENNI